MMNTKTISRRWYGFALISLLALSAVAVGAIQSGALSAGEARKVIARMPGFELSRDAVRVKEITAVGNSAVVVAQVETAFRLERYTNGAWQVAEVRTGDNRWQKVDALARSLSEEKAAVARAEMETIATALESFKRARGFYVDGDGIALLIDHLQPDYLCRVIRVDPWHQPYSYSGTSTSFALRSAGPDGKLDTPDDLAYAK